MSGIVVIQFIFLGALNFNGMVTGEVNSVSCSGKGTGSFLVLQDENATSKIAAKKMCRLMQVGFIMLNFKYAVLMVELY